MWLDEEPQLPGDDRVLAGWGGTAPSRARVVTPLDDNDVGRLLDGAPPTWGDRARARALLRRRGAQRRRHGARRHRARGREVDRHGERDGHGRRRHEPGLADALAAPPRLVRPRHPGNALRHRRRCDRLGHPRQGPPRRRNVRQPRALAHAAHGPRRGAGGYARPEPRDLLGHHRRHGAHRRDPGRDVRTHPGGDLVHLGRRGAVLGPRPPHVEHE